MFPEQMIQTKIYKFLRNLHNTKHTVYYIQKSVQTKIDGKRRKILNLMIKVGKRRQNKGRRDRWGKEKYF